MEIGSYRKPFDFIGNILIEQWVRVISPKVASRIERRDRRGAEGERGANEVGIKKPGGHWISPRGFYRIKMVDSKGLESDEPSDTIVCGFPLFRGQTGRRTRYIIFVPHADFRRDSETLGREDRHVDIVKGRIVFTLRELALAGIGVPRNAIPAITCLDGQHIT